MRTLHHRDAVGLLVPSGRTASGYHVYGEADLGRLTRVLAYQELGLRLADVARLLDDPDVDAVEHLRRQHELLVDRIAAAAVAALVPRTLEARTMGIELDPEDLRGVFGDEDPSRYAQEAQQRWGGTDAWRQLHRRASAYGTQWLRIGAAQDELEERFAHALHRDVPAHAQEARDLAEEHRQQLCAYFYEADHTLHRGLADLHVGDQRFAAHYDRRQPGLAQYVAEAVRANAETRGQGGCPPSAAVTDPAGRR